MKRKSKNILFIIIVVIILGLFLIVIRNNNKKKESDVNSQDALARQELKSIDLSSEDYYYDSKNEQEISFKNATLDDVTAYSIDYGVNTEDDIVKFKDYLSDQGMRVLMSGYPNKSFEELNCKTSNEAYLATQMAIWEIMNRTDESKKSTKIFRVDYLSKEIKDKDSFNRVTNAAKKLVKLAEENPYSEIPTLYIDNGNVKATSINKEVLIGPYKVSVSEDAEIKKIEASLIDSPTSAKITDKDGNEKKSLVNGDAVYVKMNMQEEASIFKIKFNANVNRKVGSIYESDKTSTSDYVKLDLVSTKMEKKLTIDYSTIQTLGRIELTVTDEDDKPISGATFNLIDKYNNKLIEVKSGSDGVINFYSVPIGEYTIEQVSTPSRYNMENKGKKLTVHGGKLTTIKFKNTLK